MSNGVVVTGMGVLTSISEGVPAFSAALKEGCCGITADTGGDGLGIAGRLPELGFDDRLAALGLSEELHQCARKLGRRQPRSVQVSLLTVLEGWQNSGIAEAGYAPDEIAVVLAGHNIGQADHYRAFQKFQEYPEYLSARYAIQYLDTNHIGVLSEVLGLQGEANSVGGASASGNVAILQAYRMVQAGHCKACVVVGAMADLSPVELQAFRNIGALGGNRFADEPAMACRPFDEDREGFIYGQGGACLILESEQRATARGAPRWGRVVGGAVCLDGNSLSDPRVEGEARAMRKALREAGLNADDVRYVNAHATSSVMGDQIEVEALQAVYGGGFKDVWVNATKGLTGHCLYASGVVESVASLIQIREGFLHPNRNLERPINSTGRFVGAVSQKTNCEVAVSHAFGFGGINTAIVFRK